MDILTLDMSTIYILPVALNKLSSKGVAQGDGVLK